MEKAYKEQRKEKGREKKECNEKKEKTRLKKENKVTVSTKLTEIGHEAHKDDENLAEFKGETSHKRKHEDIEQLEGSSVTEEHEHPLNLQNPSYLSDSTQNSNKRRKQVLFANDSCGNGGSKAFYQLIFVFFSFDLLINCCLLLSTGKIISIKLPLQKHKEFESTIIKKHLSSTLGGNVLDKEPDVLASREQHCSTSGRTEIFKQQNYSQYTNLIKNLCQMALPCELVNNDEEWLFRGKPSDKVLNKSNQEKQFAVGRDITCSGSSMQPCARYLQEAEMFALPYTVPF